MLTEDSLKRGLNTRLFARRIYAFDSIDSTNNCARVLAGVFAEEGTIVIAEQQTAGRGRLGRKWESIPYENLTFSVVLRPNLAAEAANLLPLYVGVAVADAVQKATGLKVECKWPNDLLIDGRKFAGILLEGSVKQNQLDYVIIGIGVNVNQTTFPPELEEGATSLRRESGTEIDRASLFREIVLSLEERYTSLASTGFQAVVPHWLSRSPMLNKSITVSYNGTRLTGIMRGLSSEGGLVLQADGQLTTLFAGDITLLKE